MNVHALFPNRAITGLLEHNSKTYARRLKTRSRFRSMATVREETQHDIEQESGAFPLTSFRMKNAVCQTTLKMKTVASQTSLKMIGAASDLAMSIIKNEDNRVLTTAPDSVEYIITLVQYGDQREKEIGACALHRLAAHTQNRSIIGQRGGIPPLLNLVQNGTLTQKNQATAAIATLAVRNDDNKLLIAQFGGISSLLKLTKEGTDKQKSLAVRALYCLAKNQYIREVIFQMGGIGPILELVVKNNTIPKLKRYATATLQLLLSTKCLQREQ